MSELNSLKEWWQTPTPPDAQTQAITDKVLETYPWFTPARLLSYMQQQQLTGNHYFPPAHEYSYNPIKYYETRQQALTPTEVQVETQETKAAIPSETEPKENLVLDDKRFFAEDYFSQLGVSVSGELPDLSAKLKEATAQDVPGDAGVQDTKDLMVMRNFADWLHYFKTKKQEEKAEEESKKALRLHWQKEKLTAAMEEEEEEIPEQVFTLAMNSIQQDDEPVSEAFAEVLAKQGKTAKAIEVYKKLSLKNPDKSNFFAAKIDKIRNSSNS